MKIPRPSFRQAGLACMIVFFLFTGTPAAGAASLELYGTYHAMGVIVTLDPGDDPIGDATAGVEYRLSGTGSYQPGFPPTRVTADLFAGSLFWLEPGAAYDVRVTFTDLNSGPLDGSSIEATQSTRIELSIPPPASSYYVSPTGSGAACTFDTPCALRDGLGFAGPGDEVVLRGGVYYDGEIDLPRSGTAGAPIVIRGQAGETAILDGSDQTDFAWAPISPVGHQTTINVPDTHLVLAGGERLYPYQDLQEMQNMSWAIPGFYVDGTDLYVRLWAFDDPNDAVMTVSRYNYAFTVEQDYIYFIDLTLRYYGQGSWAKALYFNNANDNLVQDCRFIINDLGIGIKRDSHRNVFQDCEFYDTTFMWPWDAVKAGAALETGGIRLYDPMTGRGTVIRRNTFHDYFDGFGVCPSNTADVTNETDVYENDIYNCGDDGVETDGQCSNVRIWGNTFRNVLIGISVAPVYQGPVYAIRNLIYDTGAGNSVYTGGPFKFNSGYGRSGTIYLFHNTSDAVRAANNSLYIRSPGSWDLIYARNNIWSATEYAISNANTGQPVDLDYDDLYTTLANELAWWDGLPDRHLRTFADFLNATGQESNGLNVPPGFADPAIADYTLSATSLVIDQGLVIPGINDDYHGSAPDMGAFEFLGYNLRRGVLDPNECPLVSRPDLSQVLPLPPPIADITLPWEDADYRLEPGHIDSPPGNSCLIFYQVDGYNRIAIVPGSRPARDLSLEAF
ncbi:right-handed parallel beta-helix repeat-containing protein [Acidobacteriota bacterium]